MNTPAHAVANLLVLGRWNRTQEMMPIATCGRSPIGASKAPSLTGIRPITVWASLAEIALVVGSGWLWRRYPETGPRWLVAALAIVYLLYWGFVAVVWM